MSKQKPPPKIYGALQHSKLYSVDEKALVLLFPSNELKDAAQQQVQSIITRLPPEFKSKRVECEVESAIALPAAQVPIQAAQTMKNPKHIVVRGPRLENPLQSLLFQPYGPGKDGDDLVKPVLDAAAAAEKKCSPLYKQLIQRTHKLAGSEENILTVRFPWRLRVGGLRGFRDLLLPVLHPVYGVPYIPASSLKGAARAWARRHNQDPDRLLGSLTDGVARVEIFDAFPSGPCLSVDMANPQWSWEGERVKYSPSPHALLTLEQPELVIGLAPTRRGEQTDVAEVKHWLQKALCEGLGSRVSAGYGRTELKPAWSNSKTYSFELWTQGIYGAVPPSKENNWQGNIELRPTAIRGVLRYWFRAAALGSYPPQQVLQMENEIFGALSQEGKVRLGMDWQVVSTDPHNYTGKILLEAQDIKYLELAQSLLTIAVALGGLGRGSRRPLHWNSGRMRGCHWQVDEVSIPLNLQAWKNLFRLVYESLLKLYQPEGNPIVCAPGKLTKINGKDKVVRYQDTLNKDTAICCVPSASLMHPQKVENWSKAGHKLKVIGEALDLLYSNDQFKGEKRIKEGDRYIVFGNKFVGGALEVPSFVIIKSHFPAEQEPYQIVTVFGAKHGDRALFVKELLQKSGAYTVWP